MAISNDSSCNTGFIRGILRGVRYAKSLRVLFSHRRSPSWTTLVLYSRVVFFFNEPTIRVMPDFKAVVFVEGQLLFIVATPPRRKIGLLTGSVGSCFFHNVLRRKIYPTLLRPRTIVHYSFSIISSRPAGLPESPRPRMYCISCSPLHHALILLYCSTEIRKCNWKACLVH